MKIKYESVVKFDNTKKKRRKLNNAGRQSVYRERTEGTDTA